MPQPLPAWHACALIATWFGVGRLPRAPGTWGSLAALPFAWAIHAAGGPFVLAAASAALFAVGWWASAEFVRRSGLRDPSCIVVDEVAGQWLVLAAAPLDPVWFAAGFVLFRAADIAKPWPASWADRALSGGLGIMADDAFAALWAGAVLLIAAQIIG
ncbi:MAG TPA: phosphatidylglycerophosphatase A [Alphaproteobacteria bacterium]